MRESVPVSNVSHLHLDEFVRFAFDSLRDRMCVLDHDGLIVLTNQAWDQFAREGHARPIHCGPGVNYLEICRTAMGPFGERGVEAAVGIEAVLRGSATQFSLDYHCPTPSRKAWFRVTAKPLRRPHSGAVVLHSEITSEILLAEKLRRTQAHYSALMENPVDVATVLTADGNILFQSPASEAILGIRPEELVGHAIYEFVCPDDEDAVRKLLRDCIRKPDRKHLCEFRFRNKDGSWRTVESIARKMRVSEAAQIIMNSRDCTRQKLAEAALLVKQDVLLRNREDLGSLVARLFKEQEDERRRTATELHESVGRRLAILAMQASQLVSSPSATAGGWHAFQEGVAGLDLDLRHLANGLHPTILDHLGLAVALREYCEGFGRKEGIQVSYTHREVPGRLSGHIASTLYRIAEEALANVAKHARTAEAWVTLSKTTKGIRLTIRDSGGGFDPARIEPGSGLGILVMRERMRALNGKLSVRSRPGHGTEIVAIAPLTAR